MITVASSELKADAERGVGAVATCSPVDATAADRSLLACIRSMSIY